MNESCIFHLINSSNIEVDELRADCIQKISPISGKNGELYIVVEYYDHEFCMNAALICDSIEMKN